MEKVPGWLMRSARYRASGGGRYIVVSIGTMFDDDHFAVIREVRRWRPLRLGWTWAYHCCHSTHPSFVDADIAAGCAAAGETAARGGE